MILLFTLGLVIIAGFVMMRVMSLQAIDAAIYHLQGDHEEHTIGVAGLIGWDVTVECTSECCGVCLCVYGGVGGG